MSGAAAWGSVVALVCGACTVDERDLEVTTLNPYADGGTPSPYAMMAGRGGAPPPPPAVGGGLNSAGGGTGTEGGTGGSSGAAVATLGPRLGIVNGYVAPDSNPYGIQGSFAAWQSPNNAAPQLSFPSDSVCMSGTVARVPFLADGVTYDVDGGWGMELMLTFVADSGGAGAWNRGGGSVVGLSFDITGPTIPDDVRFRAQSASEPADIYCALLGQPTSGVRVELPFESVTRDCWEGRGEPLSGDISLVTWQIPANTSATSEYNFCLTGLQPILVASTAF